MPQHWIRRFTDLLLTADPVRRIRLSLVGMALLLMSVCAGVMHYLAWVGEASVVAVWWWTLFALGGLMVVYLLIRSGVSERFRDPTLTKAQMVYTLAVGAVAYALAGAGRGAALPTVMVVLMYGAFALKPRAVAWIGGYSAALYALIMSGMAWLRPAVYLPWVELIHFAVMATAILMVVVLSSRLMHLRDRLRKQKAELASALARVKELSTRDELTGLVNRRQMIELMEQECQRCLRTGRAFCVALVDLDHFKQINDTAGHAAGDEVLCSFAREATAVMRKTDVLARWGGDEFVLLAVDACTSSARAGIERLCERIAAASMRSGVADLRITMSIGVTEHIAGETVAQTLDRADRALYEAKRRGRNCVVAL